MKKIYSSLFMVASHKSQRKSKPMHSKFFNCTLSGLVTILGNFKGIFFQIMLFQCQMPQFWLWHWKLFVFGTFEVIRQDRRTMQILFSLFNWKSSFSFSHVLHLIATEFILKWFCSTNTLCPCLAPEWAGQAPTSALTPWWSVWRPRAKWTSMDMFSNSANKDVSWFKWR